MWTALLRTDPRKTCFITVPQKWGLNLSQLNVVRIEQSTGQSSAMPVFATCAGDTGLQGGEEVSIGAQFARLNGLRPSMPTVFQVLPNLPTILSSVVAEPCSPDDWELLEMNAEQIQMDLMNRVRVVWIGACIPIWLSEHVSLTIKIVELDPKCSFGLLANDTEIHVSPPPKVIPRFGSVMDQEPVTISSVLSQLLDRYLPKPVPERPSPPTTLRLRVLPVEDPAFFLSLAAEIQDGLLMQPYMAFISSDAQLYKDGIRDCVGSIRSDLQISYFSIVFVQERHDWPVFADTIYLSETVIRQLKLNVKQRVDVVFQVENVANLCDSITFYTFVMDYDLKDLTKDTKMWLESMVKDEMHLVLNHGQHIDIPGLIKGKSNRLFVGLFNKNQAVDYCRFDKTSLAKFVEKIKVIRVKPANAPKFLQLPEDVQPGAVNRVGSIGGVTDLVQQAMDFLNTALALHNDNRCKIFSGCRQGNLLLTGPRGSGRTTIARYLCNQLESGPFYVHTVHVDCSSLKGKKVETLYRDWLSIFQQLIEREPSILVLDDLDLLASSPSNESVDLLTGESWYYTRIADVILELVNRTPFQNRVVVIATALNGKALHPKLNHLESSHFFTCELNIPPLTSDSRMDIIQAVLENKGRRLESDVVLADIVSKLDGYVAVDIENVIDKAAHLAITDSGSLIDISIQGRHLEDAVKDHIPFGLYGINLKPPADSRIAWSDVGGLTNAKKLLVETLKWPTQYPKLFARCPIRLRSALLLYGAPGTGKTMLARAVATECGVNFISIKGPELLSKYIGASEESVRETFRRARSAKPCILFFDEFDSLAPRRGHDSTGVTDRVVNQLLTELDGVEGQEAGLWILAATSRPDLIDPALLRPGRFDVSVRCPLPNKDERLEILKALSSRIQLEEDVRMEELAAETEHFTGADLQAVLYTAQLKAIHQRDEPTTTGNGAGVRITHQLLMRSLRETRPSVSASERQRYERIYESFDSGRRTASDDPHLTARVTLA